MSAPGPSPLRILFAGELRYLLRDRMALVLLLVTPVVVYPVLFWGLGAMQEENERKAETKVVQVAAPAEWAGWLVEEDHIERVEPGSEAAEDADATVEVPPALLADGPAGLPTELEVTVVYRSDRRDSRTARDRVEAVLDRQREADQAASWRRHGIAAAPDALVSATWVDVSTAQARSGHALGRFLPLLLVFLAMSGGLYAALDLIAGEKERGTLETLLTTRMARRHILRAKFLVVLLVTAAMSALAVLSLWASAASGMFTVPGTSDALVITAPTVGLTLLLILPLVVELAALMAATGAYAPDFRAGQAFALPLMLGVMAPAAVTVLPGQELGWLTGALPIAGVSLALRDALAGELDLLLAAWTLLLAVGHGVGALWVAERLMGREAVLLGGGSARARHAKGRYHVEALALFAVVVVLYLFLGQLAQSRSLVPGLILSQVLLIALPSVAAVRMVGRPLAPTLRVRAPRAADAGLGLLAGFAAPGVGYTVFHLQGAIIPVPEGVLEEFSKSLEVDLGLAAALALFALLPAVCEELLFRGAILGLIERSLPRWAVVLVVGLLFGLLHLAIFRILPTGALGIVLTWAALRSGSLFVPVLMHLLNNGLVVGLGETGWLPEEGIPLWLSSLMALVCAAAVFGMGRAGATPDASEEAAPHAG